MKTARRVSLSKDISNLISRGNRNEVNDILKDMMMYKMTIILNVLSTLMNDIIMNNLHIAIITMKWCSRWMWNSHILKYPTQPKKFRSSICNDSIFNFSIRVRYDCLLLIAQRNQLVSKEKTITNSGASIYRITSLISIKISL